MILQQHLVYKWSISFKFTENMNTWAFCAFKMMNYWKSNMEIFLCEWNKQNLCPNRAISPCHITQDQREHGLWLQHTGLASHTVGFMFYTLLAFVKLYFPIYNRKSNSIKISLFHRADSAWRAPFPWPVRSAFPPGFALFQPSYVWGTHTQNGIWHRSSPISFR